MRLKTATEQDRQAHKATGSIYPLRGVLVVDGERRLVEQLPDLGPDEPRYEIHAPDGRCYDSGEHSRLCYTMDEVCNGYGAEPTDADSERQTNSLREEVGNPHRKAGDR